MNTLNQDDINNVSGGLSAFWQDLIEVAGGIIITSAGAASATIAAASIIASDGIDAVPAGWVVAQGIGGAVVGTAMIVDGSQRLAHDM